MLQPVPIPIALERKYPEWLVFVVTRDAEGRVDLMPAGWCMQCSLEPPMLAVALGQSRCTREVIEQTREFVLAFASEGQAEAITFCGTRSGRETDKVAALGLVMQPGVVLPVPFPADCSLVFECRVAGSLPSGDHVVYTATLVAAHAAERPNLVNFGGWYSPAVPRQAPP